MLKQSLVQEKISDLTLGAPQPSTTSASVAGGTAVPKGSKVIETNLISLIPSANANYRTNTKIVVSGASNGRFGKDTSAVADFNEDSFSNNNNNNNNASINIATRSINNNNNNNNPNEMSYSNANDASNNSGQNKSYFASTSTSSFNNKFHNGVNSRNFNSSSSNNFNAHGGLNETGGGEQRGESSFEATMKLSYLEKSIRFIQQQHVDILSGLHQEIEKLKTENRELHFRLATRGTSADKSSPSSDVKAVAAPATSAPVEDKDSEAKEQLAQKGFTKAYKEATSKDADLDKKMVEMKATFETGKYDELYKKLRDAEGKNEYLTSVINQLQVKRNTNSAYSSSRHHGHHVNNIATSVSNASATAGSSSNSNNGNSVNISKLNVNHIVSVEPLKIKLNEGEEPRAPNQDETDVLIKRLFDVYKQQKQQISNMKTVLKDMINNENLSTQSVTMTKELLENPNRLSQYLLDNGAIGVQKLSVITPLVPPKSSTGRLNFNTQKFSSQMFLNSMNPTATPGHHSFNNSNAHDLRHLNLASSQIVHLPPLMTNPVKFPERQRRTQIMQKQRLRKEYFH